MRSPMPDNTAWTGQPALPLKMMLHIHCCAAHPALQQQTTRLNATNQPVLSPVETYKSLTKAPGLTQKCMVAGYLRVVKISFTNKGFAEGGRGMAARAVGAKGTVVYILFLMARDACGWQ